MYECGVCGDMFPLSEMLDDNGEYYCEYCMCVIEEDRREEEQERIAAEYWDEDDR
jgi:transcription initiation factor TFIIIB Brf1 subunit/transcription initiation factor TFIIB